MQKRKLGNSNPEVSALGIVKREEAPEHPRTGCCRQQRALRSM
jgi:hypothetical protein